MESQVLTTTSDCTTSPSNSTSKPCQPSKTNSKPVISSYGLRPLKEKGKTQHSQKTAGLNGMKTFLIFTPELVKMIEAKVKAQISRSKAIKLLKTKRAKKELKRLAKLEKIKKKIKVHATKVPLNTIPDCGQPSEEVKPLEEIKPDNSEVIMKEESSPAEALIPTEVSTDVSINQDRKESSEETIFKPEISQKIKRGSRILKSSYDDDRNDIIFKVETDGKVSEVRRFDLLRNDPKLVLYFYELHLEFTKADDFNSANLEKI